MRRARLTATIVVAATVCLAVGCGGEDNPSGGSLAALISHLPPDTATIDATDIAAARADLGLDPDANATDLQAAFGDGITADDPLQRLVSDAGIGFPAIGQALQGIGDPVVIGAIDGSKISAAVGTGQGNIQVTAISTSQSFDDIAETLTKQGFTRDGDLLSSASSQELIGGVADGGDGVVILARSPQLAATAADEHSGPREIGDLIAELSGPVRTVATSTGCVTRVAVGQSADATSGSVVVGIDGDADPSLVDEKTLDATDPGLEFSEPQADGSQLRVDYKGPAPDVSAATPVQELVNAFSVYSAYNCN